MDIELSEHKGVRLAVEGCGHGTLHDIYASVEEACFKKGWPGVDLLIIGGDFQAVRNAYDLNCVSMPAKYRAMCDFHEYYSGNRTAPYLTIFVGGNHEASNYLFELYYGGWVAPNMYYMGAANVLRFGPLRIAGMSGIWKGYNYRKPHHERLPYNETDMRSIYHVRELDVRKLLQVRTQVDVGISHDWPKGVEWKGKWRQLFSCKAHFEEDAKNGNLGSVAAQQVLDWLRPRYWFSAHLHCKYLAVIKHDKPAVSQKPLPGPASTEHPPKNEDEIDLDLDDDDASPEGAQTNTGSHHSEAMEVESNGSGVAANPTTSNPTLSTDDARAALPEAFRRPAKPEPAQPPPGITNRQTNFLALDKCLPGRRFMQLVDIPTDENLEHVRPFKLQYDREWLAIISTFAIDEPLELGNPDAEVPKPRSDYAERIDKRRAWIDEHLSDSDLMVPENFEVIAPVYDNEDWKKYEGQVREYPNPQTSRFCNLLQIPNPFDIDAQEAERRMLAGPRPEDPNAKRFDNDRGRGRGRGGGFRGGNRGGYRGGGRGRGGGGGSFRGNGRGGNRGR